MRFFSVAAFVSAPILALFIQQAATSAIPERAVAARSETAFRRASGYSLFAVVDVYPGATPPEGIQLEAALDASVNAFGLTAALTQEDLGCNSAGDLEGFTSVAVGFSNGVYAQLNSAINSTCENALLIFEGLEQYTNGAAKLAVNQMNSADVGKVCIALALVDNSSNATAASLYATLAVNGSFTSIEATSALIEKDISSCLP